MAAKPPKPPANFLKLNSNKNNNIISAKTTSATIETNNNNICYKSDNTSSNNNNNNNNNNSNNSIKLEANNALEENTSTNTPKSTPAPRPNCACTNISIMHLFHEMKQEFPTIPDTIVAQCVNENCHQRENCLQMLRNELALNPIPAQSYPAKVLQRQQQQQQQHQQQQQQQQQKLQSQHSLEKPPKPLKPTRVAPSPLQAVNSNLNTNLNLTNPQTSQLYAHVRGPTFTNPSTPLIKQQQKQQNSCDSVDELVNHICDSNNYSSSNCNNSGTGCKTKDVKGGEFSTTTTNTANTNTSDMPTTTTTTEPTPIPQLIPTNRVNNINNSVCENSPQNVRNSPQLPPPTHHPPPPPIAPRARPTTLNIQSQKEIRQQLNVQLQQHFQQQQRQQTASETTTPTTPPHQQHQPQTHSQSQQPQRPLRKAPLPPIPPKPVQISTSAANSPIHQYNNHHNNSISTHSQQQQSLANCYYNHNINNNDTASSSATSSQLTSPSSVAGESEISVNVSLLSSPATTPTHLNNNSSQLKSSPIRHRSVINVQPEPPYTRDFLVQSPTSSTSSSGAVGQKSFTSVNLTLRQPNAALPHQSTIDISAGPGLGTAGSGLTYSSTSYDARRGFQKNFQLTVTDEGGVFSASRIRPRSCIYPGGGSGIGEHEQDGPVGSITATGLSSSDGVVNHPLRTAASEMNVVQQQQQQQQSPYYYYSQQQQPQQQQQPRIYQQQQPQQQQQHQHHNVASNTAVQYTDTMCQLRQSDDTAKTIERQKMRRDKLATALRANKKKLNQMLQEIDVLKQPVNPGASERLDCRLQKLRCDIQAIDDQIENAKRCGPWQADNKASTPTQYHQQQHQQQQPFPSNRQRPPRPPPPTLSSASPRQPQLDFVQRHSSTTAAAITPNSPQQQHTAPPPTYQQSIVDQQQQELHRLQLQQLTATRPSPLLLDEEDYSEEEELEEDVEPSEMWPCNMCTFRNHPQLNICECCENIRILPAPVLSREDIHITLSPGENRIIHSWILS